MLRGHSRGLDLSRLVIRQAYLAEVEARDARLVDAHLADTVLAEAFDLLGSVVLSGDAALLAAGTSTGEVWLRQVADRTLLWAVRGHTGAVYRMALSVDGQLLASSGEDGTVRLWKTATRRPQASLQGQTGTVYDVALSADGQLRASGGGDGMCSFGRPAPAAGCTHYGPSAATSAWTSRPFAGITDAQRTALLALGAVERHGPAG